MVPAQTPAVASCPVFPSDNVWNTRVDTLPVDPRSATYVGVIGASHKLHPDYGFKSGVNYTLVSGTQTKVPVTFVYAGESDPGPYPIPNSVAIQADSDHHAMIIDTANCILYELFGLQRGSNGSWRAGSGAIFDLNSDTLRPAGWTSADAAGLPLLPGLVRYDEILSGHIDHAIRFTAPQSRNSYIWPARHFASSLNGAQYPQFGQRFRLKANFDISSFAPHVQVVLEALKTYGMILADNGAPWFISGLQDARIDDDEMHQLTQVVGADFEAIDESSLAVNVNSAQAAASAVPVKPIGNGPPSGWVNIISKNSAKCLALLNTSVARPVQQYTCVGGIDQEFEFTAVSGGYKITNRSSGLQLDVRGGPAAMSTAVVQQYPFWGGRNEIWDLTRTSDGYYQISALSSGKSLDIAGASKLDGAVLYQDTWSNADNQKWSFSPAF